MLILTTITIRAHSYGSTYLKQIASSYKYPSRHFTINKAK